MLSVRKPPSSGPITLLRPKTAPNRPWYLPRSAGAKMSAMIANATLVRAAAPRPCRARNTTSCIMPLPNTLFRKGSPAMPHRALPIRNTTIPNISTGLRP